MGKGGGGRGKKGKKRGEERNYSRGCLIITQKHNYIPNLGISQTCARDVSILGVSLIYQGD